MYDQKEPWRISNQTNVNLVCGNLNLSFLFNNIRVCILCIWNLIVKKLSMSIATARTHLCCIQTPWLKSGWKKDLQDNWFFCSIINEKKFWNYNPLLATSMVQFFQIKKTIADKIFTCNRKIRPHEIRINVNFDLTP